MNNKKIRSKIMIAVSLYFMVILLGSCEKSKLEDSNFNLKILFEYEYINWAWGYSHSGWFIDDQGEIRGYKLPNSWKNADSSGYIAYDSLLFNYNQTDTLLGLVDSVLLGEMSALIAGTVGGELSALDCHGADMGGMRFYCYLWDANKQQYKRQLLSLAGDCDQINKTPEAAQLIEYLKQVGKLN